MFQTIAPAIAKTTVRTMSPSQPRGLFGRGMRVNLRTNPVYRCVHSYRNPVDASSLPQSLPRPSPARAFADALLGTVAAGLKQCQAAGASFRAQREVEEARKVQHVADCVAGYSEGKLTPLR